MSWALWLVIAVAFAVAEILTTTLFVGPFSVGALGAMVVALAGGPSVLAFVVFLALSAVAFTIVRPIALRHRSMPARIRTGTAALIGKPAVVLGEVTRDGGTVKLEGEVWTARSYDEERILVPGTRVEVVEIQGATALVAD
jgi:membrane protein implicated in regulation of membrane protease activity